MNERQIIHKLIQDIEEKERSYQKELQKIKAEKELLAYIKGMLDITENNVVNFPYYNPNEEETKEAEEDFNVMLKYTLKDDNIISSFKSEIKNLYFLEKIGYRHAEQYQETINHLEEYRNKIKNAYQELVSNETLKKVTAKKEETLHKLEDLKERLQSKDILEISDIDSFYDELKIANLSESEKTAILLLALEKNLKVQQQQLQEMQQVEKIKNKAVEKIIIILSEQDLNKLKMALLNCNEKLKSLPITITYPNNFKTININNSTKKIIDIIKGKSN